MILIYLARIRATGHRIIPTHITGRKPNLDITGVRKTPMDSKREFASVPTNDIRI